VPRLISALCWTNYIILFFYNIRDTAGQERFRNIAQSYYRGAHGIILLYDITEQETYNNVKSWLDDVNNYISSDQTCKLLIGNKCDLEYKRTVDKAAGEELASSMGMKFIEASAKTAHNVDEAFKQLAKDLIEK